MTVSQMETVIVSRERTTIDLLLWRMHGYGGTDLLEATYAANEGIANKGTILPIGTQILLPQVLPANVQQEKSVITLFG